MSSCFCVVFTEAVTCYQHAIEIYTGLVNQYIKIGLTYIELITSTKCIDSLQVMFTVNLFRVVLV